MDKLQAEKRALFGPVIASESISTGPTSVTKVIRRGCLECSGGSRKEVRLCPNTDCPVWPWRMGVSPKTLRRRQLELLDADAVMRMRAQMEP